ARAVIAARTRLDGDRLRRADRLAELACNAALFPVGIAAQRMLTAKARGNRPFFIRIVDRGLRRKELPHGQHDGAPELLKEQCFGGLCKSRHHSAPNRDVPAYHPTIGKITSDM